MKRGRVIGFLKELRSDRSLARESIEEGEEGSVGDFGGGELCD